MDPLSITASIISITTAAVQSVHILIKTIDNIKDAPDTVKGVSTDLAALQPVLQSLQRSLQAGTSQILFSNQIKRAIENCDRACNAFSLQVGHWTRRSKEDKMFWIDKWRVGLFGLERIKTFRAQLGDYKATLSVALSTATVITNSQQEYLMKEMKDLMLQQNEVVVRQQLARANTATVELERDMQQLTTTGTAKLSPTTEQTDGPDQRQELLHELAHQNSANKTFKAFCEEAISTTVFERTGQKIKGVKATNHSFAITGFINASEQAAKMEQDISDIIAEDWSVAVAGSMDNVDFRDLMPGGAHTGGLGSVGREV